MFRVASIDANQRDTQAFLDVLIEKEVTTNSLPYGGAEPCPYCAQIQEHNAEFFFGAEDGLLKCFVCPEFAPN